MKMQSFIIIFVTIIFITYSSIVSTRNVYINQWAVQIDGNEEIAQGVADRLGYRIVDKAYLFISF